MMKNLREQEFSIGASELEFLKGTIQNCTPRTILAVDMPNEEAGFVKECSSIAVAGCHVYSVDHVSLLACLLTIKGEIDFLILNSARNMPDELLDFIAVLPRLSENAVVILRDIALQDRKDGRKFASSILFQNIVADKLPHHQELCLSIEDRIELCLNGSPYSRYSHVCAAARVLSNILIGFRLNALTRKYEETLFAALRLEWSYMPSEAQLQKYGETILGQYTPGCLQQFEQAVQAARLSFDPYGKFLKGMAGSYFPAFRKVLLYGSGKRGQYFLDLAQKWRIPIGGFVVSDGQASGAVCKGLPVYAYSKIPYKKNEVLIIQTAVSKEIERRLLGSGYCWIKLPDGFWGEPH